MDMTKKQLLIVLCLLASAFASSSQVLINEVCAANGDVVIDSDYYNFSGWIELYNSSAAAVNIGGYYLSDESVNKNKWRVPTGTSIPAKGFIIFWCDKENKTNHTNFSLDSDGEQVVFSNGSQLLVDKIIFPKQYTNVSYGRLADGGEIWGYMTTPTFKNKNNSDTGTERLTNPAASVSSGRYESAQTVVLSHALSDVDIYYTSDGAEPSLTSTKYKNPITINKTQTLKAKTFKKDYLPSKAEVKTYFINEHAFTLPTLSVSTSPDYLWDNTIGIYTDGTNGVAGNCQLKAVNWNQDWDRHAVLEYFDANGEKQFDQGVDIRIGGACSRGNDQKSFVVKPDDKYGKNHINEKLFDNKTADRYGSFMYRNAGNDNNTLFFRDALIQHLAASQMDVDYMDYKPTVLYLNGNYWGIQNMREKIDGDFIESNYGIDKDDIDLIDTYGNAIEGTPDAYNSYLNDLQQMDLSAPAAFTYIDDHIDVQEFINYLTTEIYVCNTDWPGNNIKFWHQRSTNGKFRWILWDTDFGLGLYAGASYAEHPTFDFVTDDTKTDWPNPAWSTLHIRLLLQNPTFKERFIKTFATAMSTTFSPTNFNIELTKFADRIKSEIPYHKTRWGGTLDGWNKDLERAKNFIVARQPFMAQHLAEFFGLNDRIQINITSSPTDGGSVVLNNVNATTPVINGYYYKDMAYSVSAAPAPGYAFKSWKITESQVAVLNFISKENTWHYFDKGMLPANEWMSPTFNDGTWIEGQAKLGYGDGDENTVVSYGPNASDKFVTTYFRKTFSITAAQLSSLTELTAAVNFDDGVVVYLNGSEVYRNNMPEGNISYTTLAKEARPTENVFNNFTLDKALVTTGINTLAVEIHQTNGTSSDIAFDLSLTGIILVSSSTTTSTAATLSNIAKNNITLEALYEPVAPIDGIIINELGATTSTVSDENGEQDDWIELYNTGNAVIDLAGLFITDDLSTKNKFRIPQGSNAETLLAPKTYKILWADNQPAQGALHIGFKLSGDGEAVGLYQAVGNAFNTLDEVTFPSQEINASYARIPNITGPFTATGILTPEAENEFKIVTALDDEKTSAYTVYPNPTDDEVNFSSSDFISAVTLYDMYGKTIIKNELHAPTGKISLRSLPAGIYILQMQSSQNTIRTFKVLKH